MNTKMNDKTLTIFLNGHIDSANAPSAEVEIMKLIGENKPEELILDAADLNYISSAGLRIVLKLRKMFAAMKVINASNDVYDIFDVTGFTELVDVEKAYRNFDVSNCEMIGEGANGWVYRVNGDTIVKVYKDADVLDDIKRERELSRTAFLLGIPTAISFDVVKVGSTYGVVFELLNAKSYCELMKESPDNLEFCASESIRVLKTIHSTDAPDGLPHQKDDALRWAHTVKDHFTPEQYDKMIGLIEAVPEDGRLMHGDFHLKNIMLNNEETQLIDMDTLCTGHPIFELAFMFNAYKGFGVVDKAVIENFFGIPAELAYKLWRRSLELYFDTDDKEYLDKIELKASIIGYLRLMSRVIRKGKENTENGRQMMSACLDKIVEALGQIDSLTF